MTLQLPAAFTLPAGKTEDTQEFVLETARDRDRFITAADLLPGNPAIVHDAIIFVRDASARETVLATWLPGSTPVSTGAGIGFLWRAGEQLGVRIHYRKTWKFENKPASDRSTVGLYLSNAPARDVRRLDLTAAGAVLEEDAQALAVVALRTAGAPPDMDVRIEAIRPDGSRVPVVGFGAPPRMGSALLARASAHAAERHAPRREELTTACSQHCASRSTSSVRRESAC